MDRGLGEAQKRRVKQWPRQILKTQVPALLIMQPTGEASLTFTPWLTDLIQTSKVVELRQMTTTMMVISNSNMIVVIP